MENKINNWCENIYKKGCCDCSYDIEKINPFEPYIWNFQSVGENFYVKFTTKKLDVFYSYFQPSINKKAPLLVHLPGYGGEMSMHPELSERYNVLHINPLGYTSPKGKDKNKMTLNGVGEVFVNTALKLSGGYDDFFTCAVIAIEWAKKQASVLSDRISFFGTSQGGGSALILASIYSTQKCVCSVASDQPFLTNFKDANYRGAYSIGQEKLSKLSKEDYVKAFEQVDTINHVYRLNQIPVLLTSGGKDDTCPKDTVVSLFEKLNGTKSYTCFNDLTHGYNRQFISLAKAWFNIYA